MSAAFEFVGTLYITGVLASAVIWAFSIYKTARVRQFALTQVVGQLPRLVGLEEKKRRQETIRFIIREIRRMDRLLRNVGKSAELDKVVIDIVSLYILRARLGVHTDTFAKLLARSSLKVVDLYMDRIDDLKRQVESQASSFNPIDRQLIIDRFVSNMIELNKLIGPQTSSTARAETRARASED